MECVKRSHAERDEGPDRQARRQRKGVLAQTVVAPLNWLSVLEIVTLAEGNTDLIPQLQSGFVFMALVNEIATAATAEHDTSVCVRLEVSTVPGSQGPRLASIYYGLVNMLHGQNWPG